jgi:AcrR family transcriptional regulator
MSDRRYAGATGEERRQIRRRRLLDAAAALVRAHGFARVSYRAVCRTAGLTERYFYESFANTDELLNALVQEQLDESVRRVVADVVDAGPEPRQAARAAIASFVDQVADDALLARILVESAAHPALREIRRRALATYVELIVMTGQQLIGEPVSASADRRAWNTAVALVGAFSELLSGWLHDSTVRGSREDIIDDMSGLFFAIIDHITGRGGYDSRIES